MMLIQEGVPEPAGATSFLPLSPDWLRLWRYYDARAPEKLPEPEAWPAASREPVPFERMPVPGTASVRRDRHRERPAARRGRRQAPRHRRQRDADRPRAAWASPRTGFALKAIARLRAPRAHRAGRSRQGRARRLPRRRPGLVPAGRPRRRRRLLAASAAPTARSSPCRSRRRSAAHRRRPRRRLRRRRRPRRDRRQLRLALHRQRHAAREPHEELEGAGVRAEACSIRGPARSTCRSSTSNKDGKPDFVVLLAQQHESVVAFVNRGKGLEFTPQDDLRGAAPELGVVGHRSRRSRQGRRPGRAPRPTATPSTTSS